MARRTRRSNSQEASRTRSGASRSRRTSRSGGNISMRERGNSSANRSNNAGTRKARLRSQAIEEDVGDMSRQDLYRRAQKMGIEGRSQMNKRELMMAVRGK